MKAAKLLALLSLVLGMGVPAARAAGCAEPGPGGEWRSYGHDLSNSRNQDLEDTIDASNASALTGEWAVATSQVGATGGYSNTPVVADGCLYLGTNTGFVIALNAQTGDLVWRTLAPLPGAGGTLLGGVIVGSPVVENGLVYVGVSRPNRPYVAALDQQTGAIAWTAVVEGYQANHVNSSALINASPVFYRTPSGEPRIFQGFLGSEGSSNPRGGYAIVDASPNCDSANLHINPDPAKALDSCNPAEFVEGATGGMIVDHTYTIDQKDFDAGYRGASVWCTAAIDPVDLHAYACGGNPASKRIEHRNSNALLKIDLDETSATFGEIVDSYKGEYDQYYPGLDRQPVCDMFGDQLVVVWSLACLQLDLDFGASPNLYRDSTGNLMVGDLQKSGVYHALYADHMQRAWTALVGQPCLACNAASPAYDAERKSIYTAAVFPTSVWSLDPDNGRYKWVMPFGDAQHFQPVSTANGVVYTMDDAAALNVFDADSGLLLMKRPMSVDVGTIVTDAGSAGVAVARNTVYAASGEWVVAYRLG